MASAAPRPEPLPRNLPVLLPLLAASGCAGLIYEIVWYQTLALVIGSTAVSLGFLLAAFMGGLCLGSLLLPRRVRGRGWHPLRVYAALELATGVLGLGTLGFFPLAEKLYLLSAGPHAWHGLGSMLLRGGLSGVCLLLPTTMMGASLPALANWIRATPEGVAWWGWLYGANIAGAVAGCLVAGFYLLRVSDLAVATCVAAGMNLAVAGLSWRLAAGQRASGGTATSFGSRERDNQGRQRVVDVYVCIGLSGLTALGAEVVWTRLMSLLLGATVYTFSLILAVLLIGLGLGSAWGAQCGKRFRARTALAWSQLGVAAGVAWGAWMLGAALPYWPVNPLLSLSPWYIFPIDLLRCLWTLLPAAVFGGASFSLALAAAAGPDADPGCVVGGIYAANTVGAILGALAFSLSLVPWIGTHNCERVLIVVSALSGLLLLRKFLTRLRWSAVATATALIALAWFAVHVPAVPGELLAYGRRTALNAGQSQILYTAEGRNASIAVSEWNDGAIQFHVSGKVVASTEPFDMRLQRILGDVPGLVHPKLNSVLVVGFGAGVTAGTFTTFPDVRRIVICEIEPLIPPAATRFFRAQNFDVLHDPRTTMIYDDARHYILTTQENFDLITADPIHPWVKGAAALYSEEYFRMERAHLNPGGVVTQWVPLYESSAEVVKSEIATFFRVFPQGSIWANALNGGGYDLVLLGSNGPLRVDLDAVEAELRSPAYAKVATSLEAIGFTNAVDLYSTYAGRARDLQPWLEGAPINRDGNLRLQYLAGLALNRQDENAIYGQIERYRKFPDGFITGSPQTLAALRASWGQ
ncbi:MAG: fused MFS/spermidine synthase [Terriglobales bacterium]